MKTAKSRKENKYFLIFMACLILVISVYISVFIKECFVKNSWSNVIINFSNQQKNINSSNADEDILKNVMLDCVMENYVTADMHNFIDLIKPNEYVINNSKIILNKSKNACVEKIIAISRASDGEKDNPSMKLKQFFKKFDYSSNKTF